MTPPMEFEPFRAKIADPITHSTVQQRRRFLFEAEHNLFRLRSEQVIIDLLTDSGTGAMSSNQWAAIMRGDESYAGSMSYFRLADVVKKVFGMPHMLPTHQGRIAERLLVEAVIGKTPAGNGLVVPNNAHFDTTRCMIETSGAEAFNLLCEGGERAKAAGKGAGAVFKGNMDLHKLEALLKERGDDVPFVMVTVTCNSNGGQPVSMENLRGVRSLCDRFGKMLFLDACRFAENAWFIKEREAATGSGNRDRSVASIVREMFDLADGAVMSAKKDGLCNVGGLLVMRDEHFYRKACNLCVLTEGFQMTYGSLPGRDLEAMAVGLVEAMDATYLQSRVEQVRGLAIELASAGIAVVEPTGGHAVYLDAEDFCPHLSRAENPAHSLACAVYEEGGIRCTRIGSVLKNGVGEPMELVRMAIPRRLYNQTHMEYVARTIIGLKARASEIQPIKSALPAAVRMEEPALEAV